MKKKTKARCGVFRCMRVVFARGVCKRHYNVWYRLDDKGDGPLSRLVEIANFAHIPDKTSPGRPSVDVGSKKVHNGYVFVKISSDHMLARKDRVSGTWVLEHRLIMSEKMGRPLRRNEIVKHKDGDRSNNDYDNLYIAGSE